MQAPKEIIAAYSPDVPHPIYCRECWYSDKWDARDYGRDYDFNKNFFEQFRELLGKVPRPALIGSNNVDSPYMNYTADVKNCYYSICSAETENCGYTYRTFRSKECFDCFGVVDSEYCHESSQSSKCFRVSSAENSEGIIESAFIQDSRNLSNCLGCINLKNKQYHYLNRPIEKEEFMLKRKSLGTYTVFEKTKEEARALSLQYPRRFAKAVLAVNSSGNELAQTKNCRECFFVRDGENLARAYFCSNMKDARDFNFADNSELVYESANIEKNYHELFSLTSWFSNNVTYCDLCLSSSHMFGCVGARSKEYCILNKQYAKGEYEKLKNRIITHMSEMPYRDKANTEYRYGEFFPPELSPFAYNETVAQEYFPLTREAAKAQGYRWKEPATRDYKITHEADKLPDDIQDVDDSILGAIISCTHKGTCNDRCTTAFKIIPAELQFYKTINLPLPRLCPNCRHYERLRKRNPLKIWSRKCQCAGAKSSNGAYTNTGTHAHGAEKCPNGFETSYAPERQEIVYCEQCYQSEVV
jgi:hypothetical protein